jgi:hypothetical protein
MKIHPLATALSAVLAILLTSAGYADQRSKPQSGAMGTSETHQSVPSAMTFESLDINQDGSLSLQEAANSRAAIDWSAVDKNNDSKIDRSEFSAFEAPLQRRSPSTGTESRTRPGVTGTDPSGRSGVTGTDPSGRSGVTGADPSDRTRSGVNGSTGSPSGSTGSPGSTGSGGRQQPNWQDR